MQLFEYASAGCRISWVGGDGMNRSKRIATIMVIAALLAPDAGVAISDCAWKGAWVRPGSGLVPMNAVFRLSA